MAKTTGLWQLDILAFNSLFEMLRRMPLALRVRGTESFNSLFEMPALYPMSRPIDEGGAFNSLFEMLCKRRAELCGEMRQLSILYLRCRSAFWRGRSCIRRVWLSILYLRCNLPLPAQVRSNPIAFNSLFEMHRLVSVPQGATTVCAFNSLFEMLGGRQRQGVFDARPFQFSI